MREVADLASVEAIEIGQDSVERVEFILRERGQVRIATRDEPVLLIPEELFLPKLGLSLRDELVANRS